MERARGGFLKRVGNYPLFNFSYRALDILMKALSSYRIPSNYEIYHLADATLSSVARRMKPCVVTVHDLIPFMHSIRMSSTEIFPMLGMKSVVYADRALCDSESSKKDLLRFTDIDAKKVKVIYLGVDHELFHRRDKRRTRLRLSLPANSVIVLNVGTEETRKNIPTLFKAFHKLLKDVPEALLVRIGRKSNQSKRLIRQLGIEDRVVYRYPSAEEVAYYYNAADVLCFPSYFEGFGLPVLEAMASRLPVVAGNSSSTPEVIGDTGILVKPFDVEGFAHWMHEISEGSELRNIVSEKEFRRSLTFSWGKCARETLEV
jgi:glycosyltransferase involved in cell wall biosynthesis